MSMKIWYQSMVPIDHCPRYRDSIERHALRVCELTTQVRVNGASTHWYGGRYTPAELLKYPYIKHTIQQEAIDYCRTAATEGYDAVILGSYSEPYLAEIRSLLDIPVVSMPEASLLLACSLSEKFALIPISPSQVKRVSALVQRHALGARVTQIESLTRSLTEAELEEAMIAPQAVINDFAGVARRLVAGGADVIIPTEGVISELLFWNGVHKIDDATVLDCIGAALANAEMMVRLKRTTGMGVGRRWAYVTPPQEILDFVHRPRS